MAQQQSNEPNFDEIPSGAFESHRPSRQAPTQKKLLLLPADLAVLINLTLGHARIDQLFRGALKSATGILVDFSRKTHLQGLMGPLVVKLLTPLIQPFLTLLSQAFKFQTHVTVQAFMSGVILGTSGSTTLQIDS